MRMKRFLLVVSLALGAVVPSFSREASAAYFTRKYTPGVLCQSANGSAQSHNINANFVILNNDKAICPTIKEDPTNGLYDFVVWLNHTGSNTTSCQLCASDMDGSNTTCDTKIASGSGHLNLTWTSPPPSSGGWNRAWMVCWASSTAMVEVQGYAYSESLTQQNGHP
jgi:hypothetical protein